MDVAERVLVKQIADGDRAAMSRFVLSYQARLARFLRRYTWRQELVEEVINETMLIVWQRACRFRFESRVSSWVIGIAYRRAMRAFRVASRRRIGDARLAWNHEFSLADQVQEQLEMTDWLRGEILKLPFEQRTALELVYHGGYSCKEVGVIMGCPTSTIKTRMFHARRKLRFGLMKDDLAHRSLAILGRPERMPPYRPPKTFGAPGYGPIPIPPTENQVLRAIGAEKYGESTA